MLERLRTRLSYSNVVATLALFLALGGSAYAAAQITGDDVKDGSLTGADVRNDSLMSADVQGLHASDFTPRARERLRGQRGAPGAPGPKPLQIHRTFTAADGVLTLFTKAGLKVQVKCSPSAHPDSLTFTASTDTDNSIVGIGPVAINPTSTGQGANTMPGVDDDFDKGEFQTLDVDDTTTVMSYGRGPNASPVVTATFLANYFTETGECKVVGTVVGG